jgi:hypothetical protein
MPRNLPKRKPPKSPVTSPGIGAATTWEAWSIINPIKAKGPRESRKCINLSLLRKKCTNPVS